jgi:hypothetical protein
MRGVIFFDQLDSLDILASEQFSRGRIFILSGSVRSKSEFIELFSRFLPMDPPLKSTANWDAFLDSLCAGISSLRSRQVVVVCETLGEFKKLDSDNFSVAVNVLNDVADDLKRDDGCDFVIFVPRP